MPPDGARTAAARVRRASARAALLFRMAKQMRAELAANEWKGDGWNAVPLLDLSNEVIYHAAKLDLAVRANDRAAVRELAADTANCAALLADAAGALDLEPPAPQQDAVCEITEGYRGTCARGRTGCKVDHRGDSEAGVNTPGSAHGGSALKSHVDRWQRTLADLHQDQTNQGDRP